MNPSRLIPIAGTAAALAAGCAYVPAVPFEAEELFGGTARMLDLRPVPTRLPPAARPAYARGDTFIYGRMTVRRVTAVDGDRLEWTTQDGAVQAGARDFFVPPLRHEPSGSRVSSTIDGRPSTLWPLQVGNRVRFEEVRRTEWPSTGEVRTQRYAWDCEVEDMRVSYVPAGDFDTFHVVCRSYAHGFPLPVQVLTWDYAPSLGHYVRRTWFDERKSREIKLSAALPGELATETRIAAVLERLAAEAGAR